MYDEEIERAILFYVIFEKREFELTEEDFSIQIHKKIINAIRKLKLEKKEVSMISINEILEEDSIRYLAFLNTYIAGTDADAIYESLKEYTKKRQVFNLANKIINEIKNSDNSDIYIEKIISDLQKIEFQTNKEESFVSQVVETAKTIEKKINKKEDLSLYTGFFDLDDLTDGLHDGELTVVGARPGVGKTTFALQIAENISKKGKQVVYISLEMSSIQMIQKLIAMRTGINSRKIRNGDLNEKEIEEVGFDCMKLGDLKLNILTKINDIQKIEIAARRLKNRNKIDVLIIDYLQLVKNLGNFRSREQEVADISRTLKLLSLELEIPIIALCQLNRNASKSEPTLADIRESGAIEQDADNVIFLYQKNIENNIVTVDLQKQRAGNIGNIELKFNKRISQFQNLER